MKYYSITVDRCAHMQVSTGEYIGVCPRYKSRSGRYTEYIVVLQQVCTGKYSSQESADRHNKILKILKLL